MQFFPDFGYGLHRVIYVSRSLIDDRCERETIIAGIVAASAANNRAKAITGALLAYDGWFVQVLEGPRESLKPLFDAIAADPRHTEVALKVVEPAPRRLFSRWGMKQGRRPEGAAFDVEHATAEALLAILKLSVLSPTARAA